MDPVRPKISDIDDLARLHIAAWQETYRGLLPDQEIARWTVTFRRRQWERILGNPQMRAAWLPGLGFAFAGPQRDEEWTHKGYRDELHAIYILREGQGQGLGRALFNAVRGSCPFTLWVLDGNEGAMAFYASMGGEHLATRREKIGETEITEHAFGWPGKKDSSDG